MRIFVVEPLGQGGLIHYSYHLCRALQRHGNDVTLITSTEYELDDLDHEFRLMRFLRLWHARQKATSDIQRKLRRIVRGGRYIFEMIRLMNLLQREKPDVVLFGEIRFSFERLLLQRLSNNGLKLADIVHDVRTYDTSQNSDVVVKEDQETINRYNQIYSLFDMLFVHDRRNYDLFLKLYDVPASKVREIPHGANEIMLEMAPSHTADELRHELDIPENKPLILFFGTVARYKGIEDLIQAYPAVCAELDVHLLIAGFPSKDTDPDSLIQMAKDLNVNDHITWYLDYVPNEQVLPLMEMSSVVALPYRAISQSGVIHIAYACGRPVLATRVGGLADVIEDGKSGILVEPGDLDSLSQGFIAMLKSPERTAKMGERARELAETQYSWKRVAQLVSEAMEQL